jgi:hypothetical protein
MACLKIVFRSEWRLRLEVALKRRNNLVLDLLKLLGKNLFKARVTISQDAGLHTNEIVTPYRCTIPLERSSDGSVLWSA